jgi:hypothetical protein
MADWVLPCEKWTAIARRLQAAHQGIDIDNPIGYPIQAVGSGTVTDAGPASGFGNWIRIKHDGANIGTVYGHMYDDGVLVKSGQRVSTGQQIGKVGSNGHSTGPHLHFELRLGGVGGLPVDGLNWLAARGAKGIPASLVSASGGPDIPISPSVPSGLALLGPLSDALKFIINPHNWFRIAMFILGLGLVYMGIKGLGLIDTSKIQSTAMSAMNKIPSAKLAAE